MLELLLIVLVLLLIFGSISWSPFLWLLVLIFLVVLLVRPGGWRSRW
jgi:hypothetical protein